MANDPETTQIPLAGYKVRKWRKSQTPRVTLEKMAQPFGLTGGHWARFERGQTDPSLRIMKALDKAGIASLRDWTLPAPACAGGSDATG